MKIIIFSILLSALFCQDLQASGGFIVGNGGDVIRCARGRFAREKLYALDYMVAHSYMQDTFSVINYENYHESFEKIESVISEKLPTLLLSFQEFNDLLLNSDNNKKYSWKKVVELSDISDEGSYTFPGKCKNEYNTMGFVEQAIVREARIINGELKVTFFYNLRLITSLKATYPLQFSFLALHEWLWNFTKDPEVIRRVNYFFHSKEFQNMSTEKILLQLKKFHFNVPQS